MGAARRNQGAGRRHLIQPVEGLGQAGEEFPVAGQAIEADHRADIGRRGVGGEGLGLDGAGRGGLQGIGKMLQAPGGLGHGLLGPHESVHATPDSVEQAGVIAPRPQ